MGKVSTKILNTGKNTTKRWRISAKEDIITREKGYNKCQILLLDQRRYTNKFPLNKIIERY